MSRTTVRRPQTRRDSGRRGATLLAACLVGTGLLSACGGSGTTAAPAGSTGTAGTSAPATSASASGTASASGPGTTSSVMGAPVGPDVSCIDAGHCFFRNPQHRTDAQIAAFLTTEPGARQTPAAGRQPWPFVVLDAGTSRLDAVASPSAAARRVGDQYGVLNHRVVFAWCRQDADGHAVGPTTPASRTWYQIDPVGAGTARVWFSGAHLHPYLSNGAIPSCR